MTDTAERRDLATVELLGALTYGQLRAFEVTARAIARAPDARTADRLADLAVQEHRAYVALRDHLLGRTELAAAVIDRQKDVFDAFFDAAPMSDWRSACTFFAVGLPIAADFTRLIAPTVPDETATVIVAALADRGPFEAFALDCLRDLMVDDASRDEVRRLVADMLGRVLTGFQGAIADTDALRVLLSSTDVDGDAVVRRAAVSVLENHRRRMHELGIEDLS